MATSVLDLQEAPAAAGGASAPAARGTKRDVHQTAPKPAETAPCNDRIFLRGLRVEALIGIYPHERDRPQPLLLDIELGVPHSRACFSDDLDDAVDYGSVVQLVRRLAAQNRSLLLEAFAQNVADALFQAFGAQTVAIDVVKPGIFAGVDAAGIAIRRQRPLRGRVTRP